MRLMGYQVITRRVVLCITILRLEEKTPAHTFTIFLVGQTRHVSHSLALVTLESLRIGCKGIDGKNAAVQRVQQCTWPTPTQTSLSRLAGPVGLPASTERQMANHQRTRPRRNSDLIGSTLRTSK